MPKDFDTYSLNNLPKIEALNFLSEISANLSTNCSAMARLERKAVPSFGHTKAQLLEDIRDRFATLILFMYLYDPGAFDKDVLRKHMCDFTADYSLSQMTDQIRKDTPNNPLVTPFFLGILKRDLLRKADEIMKEAEAPIDKSAFDNIFNSSAAPIDEDTLIDIMRNLDSFIPRKPDQDKPE